MIVTVAFSTKAWQDRLSQLLSRHGITFKLVSSGHEAIRMAAGQPSLIMSNWKLTDMTAGQLARRIRQDSAVMVLDKAFYVKETAPNMTLIPLPTTSAIIITAVINQLAIPLKTFPNPPSDQLIWQAKDILITTLGYSEQQAHRYLQKTSMKTGRPIDKVAAEVISQNEKEEK